MALLAPLAYAQSEPEQGVPEQEVPDSEAEAADESPALVLPGLERLTIGGQYRLRFEGRSAYEPGSPSTFDTDAFLQRIRIDLDFQIDDGLRVFVQVQDARLWGEEDGSTTDRASPGLDLHQGYLEIGDVALLGGETRVGRQVLNYGDQRLVGGLEWLNQGRTFNALRHRWSGDAESEAAWEVDLFGAQIAGSSASSAAEENTWFGGVYATREIDEAGSVADVYALLLQDDETAVGGSEARVTLGARWVQQFEGLELGVEAATQVGEIDGRDVPIGKTFAAHAHVKIDLAEDGATFVRAEFDAASGDDASTGANERFDNLFPTAHAFFGVMDLVLWENIVHGGLQFTTPVSSRSRLTIAAHQFSAFEAGDGVRGPGGILSQGGPGVSQALGQEVDLVWHQDLSTEERSYTPHIELGYGLFLPGEGVRDSIGSDELAHFLYLQGGVVF